MDKVIQSHKNIKPFGGLNFIYEALGRAAIADFLNQQIGHRSKSADYSHSAVVLSLLGNPLVQGSSPPLPISLINKLGIEVNQLIILIQLWFFPCLVIHLFKVVLFQIWRFLRINIQIRFSTKFLQQILLNMYVRDLSKLIL